MTRCALAAVVAAVLSMGAGPKDQPDDYQALQGAWDLVETWRNGEKSVVKPWKIIFDGKLTDSLPPDDGFWIQTTRSTFTLSSNGPVKQIVMFQADYGRGQFRFRRCVYALDGDTLSICYSDDATAPVKIPDKDGPGTIHVYKRSSEYLRLTFSWSPWVLVQ